MVCNPGNAEANLGDLQSWNEYAYAYVSNNPLIYTDPEGMLLSADTTAGFCAGGQVAGCVIGGLIDLLTSVDFSQNCLGATLSYFVWPIKSVQTGHLKRSQRIISQL